MTSAEAAAPGPRRKGGRAFKIVIGIAVAVALLWTGGWFAASRYVGSKINAIEARANAEGATLSCGNPSIGGFPFRFDVTCMPVAASCPAKEASIDLAGFEVVALAYNPNRALFAAKGPLAVKGPEGASLDANWTSLQSSLSLGLSGLNRYSLVADGLDARIAAPTRLPAGVPLSADHAEFHVLRDGDAPGFLDVAASVSRLSAALPGRPALPVIDGDVTAIVPEALVRAEHDVAAAWVASGQPVRIEQLNATIGGVATQLSGEVTPAADGLLNGSLTVRLDQLDKLPDLVEGLKPGSGAKVKQMIGLVSALLRPVTVDGRSWREAKVTIASGKLMLGFIPLGTLPRIGHQLEAPAAEGPAVAEAAPTGPAAAIAPGGEAAGKSLSAMAQPKTTEAATPTGTAAAALPEAVVKRCAVSS